MTVTVPSFRVDLLILGEPVGKARPRFNRATGRAYTPTRTQDAEHRIRHQWQTAGEPRLPDGQPLGIEVSVYMQRPKDHHRANGTLSAAGERSRRPMKRPDADNILKGVLDALNGLAFRDDALFVEMQVRKWWAPIGAMPHLRVGLWVVRCR